MKKIIFFCMSLLSISLIGQADEQNTIAKFIITDARDNGNDITPEVLDAEAYTVFYTSGNDNLMYMANVWPNNNSQSYGPMYGVETETYEETATDYKTDIFYFNWSYTNTYDGKSGTAKVQVIKIYKPQGVAFTLKIVPENLDILIYKGYMDGSIDFSKFNEEPVEEGDAERFRVDYNYVSVFDPASDSWTEWAEGDNTFVININNNGDIAHYKPNGEVVTYRKVSEVERGTTDKGDTYQIIKALDESGLQFRFQLFDDIQIGLKLIYADVMVQFAWIGQ